MTEAAGGLAHWAGGVLASAVVALLARVCWRVGGCLGVGAALLLWATWAALVWLLLVALADLAAGRL
jgi:hypothetical protein